ncbi:phosphoribosylaminoimidazolesuccinocarboxamide synthase [Woeseia oceani]|uniref:Phosphoribosylaminoimidazole-succinocarboxamide synthase n=1 Tax=Woeseia oceani TaxID=1548547 RepID=A0A193LHM4_9GAMM|nr:phosphoribosylaminoimidazolesuccinocarboxamide synthase [Woeseia oceani]ANO51976.1 phosphoribosylaminoimidazolesuccinocarboxamide synthase [Woeseia oceani]
MPLPTEALFESDVPSLTRLARGKVRDIYAVDDDHLMIVTTDRLSAYDVVLPDPVPGKGYVLTQLSNFWFERMASAVPNHLTSLTVADVVSDPAVREPLEGRTIVVKRLQPLPVEAVVRGYLIGSGWRDYCDTGALCGIQLPSGLQQAAKLPEPLFTPATKAAVGDHDENIDFATCCDLIGRELAERVRAVTIDIYLRASEYAASRGIIVADTKFEFGLDDDGKLYLIDEALTPDSSRFWPQSEYRTGISPPSYDKQFVRDYLDTLSWDKTAPGPALPSEVLQRTAAKYREVLERLTGTV